VLFKENDVKTFEEIYQAIVLECRKYGKKDLTRAEVQEMLDESEKQGAITKIDKK